LTSALSISNLSPLADDNSGQRNEPESTPVVPVNAVLGPDLTPEQILQAIKDDFGDIASEMVPSQPETLLASSKGTLFKGVMLAV
jgi:hypothetical protein